MTRSLNIAFFGSSLVSAYWNGAATYYRGIIRALNQRGHKITFYEPDAYDRQKHRDIPDPEWAKIVVYDGEDVRSAISSVCEAAATADILVKASGVGVFDAVLERALVDIAKRHTRTVFWDVDAPATLDRLASDAGDPLRSLVPRFAHILTYGGGDRVVRRYRALGARHCVPVYNALDPDTHFCVDPDARFACDIALLANRLPDREARTEEFFFSVAQKLPEQQFLLAGSGWADKPLPRNVRYVGHLYTADHNAFNCSARLVLNISRDSMAQCGYSPATRVFEAAGAAACIVTDDWQGIEQFLEPNEQILVAKNGDDVARFLCTISYDQARQIGLVARKRVLEQHTYALRARQVEALFAERAPSVEVAP